MQKPIGQLLLGSGQPLLRMWDVDVEARNRPFVKHSHTRFEFTVVVSGAGEYTTERTVYPMEPGDIFVFSSNEVHCITKAGPAGLVMSNLHFEPRYLSEEFFEVAGESYISFCYSHAPTFQNRIPAAEAAVIRNHFEQMKAEFRQEQTQYPLAIRAHLQLMLVELLRSHGYQTPGTINGKHFELLEIFDYIDSHLDEEITLQDLAKLVNLSPNYLSHLFKKLNGTSLWEYITAKRIERAVRLIRSRENDLTMLDIALQCGFNNTVNFNKAFKKHKGITPRELRKDPGLLSY